MADGFAVEWQKVPSYLNLAKTLTHDEQIRPLLKQGGAEPPTVYSFLFGSVMWVMKVPAGLLAASCFDLLAADEPMSGEAITRAIVANIARLRRIGTGKEVDCALAVGLEGIGVKPGRRVETKLGVIRPSGPLGKALESFGHPATTLFCGRFSMRFQVVAPNDLPVEERAFENVNRIGRVVRLMRLAVILADSEMEERLRPVPSMHIVTAPYMGFTGGMRLAQLDSQRLPRKEPLTDQEAEGIQHWVELLTTREIDNVDIAVGRIVTAATERQSAEDVLIDAVIAWESLVGADGETTFRVAASLAHLLEPAVAGRKERLKELRELYRERSKVVHGQSRGSKTVNQSANRALEIAKQGLAAMLTDHPWLFGLRTSQERSDAILLAYPPGDSMPNESANTSGS